MDRKSIIVLVASFLFILTWGMLVNRIWPPQPVPKGTNALLSATNVWSQSVTDATPSTSTPAPAAILPQTFQATTPLAPEQPEQTVTLENDQTRFVLTSHAGGVKLVELKQYPAVVTCNKSQQAATNRVTLNKAATLPSFAVFGEALLGDGIFQIQQSGDRAIAEKTLNNGLHLVKEFKLTSNYLWTVNVRLENRTNQPVSFAPQEWTLGSVTTGWAGDDPTRLGVYWYDGKEKESVNESWFANRGILSCIGIQTSGPRSEYLRGSNNVVWAAVHGQFFALAVMPKEPAPQIRVVPATTPGSNGRQTAPAGQGGLRASLVYPAGTLAAGQSLERQFLVYSGPKEYKRLVRLADQYKNKLDGIMDYDGFFGWFAQVLLSSMNGLNALGLSYALAIIAITIIIKVLFWPLTNASTRSMKRMAALQPQMNALREKYKDNPTEMNRKMMAFMKEHKVSPLGGCLPMLLQIPVFFGFFTMIQNAIELRGARFLWVCDLSRPDTLFRIPGLDWPFNPLPLLMGLTMLWQARLTPPSPGMDPMQQKLMRYMPLMFLVLLYNFSAGLTLYWTVQNLLTIAQMKLTKSKDEPAAPAAPAAAHGFKRPPESRGPRRRK